MIRRDVMHLATDLAAASGLSADAVYCWLMKVGKEFGTNPRNLTFKAGNGYVWYNADTYIGTLPTRAFNYDAEADYWEGRILARQERYMD